MTFREWYYAEYPTSDLRRAIGGSMAANSAWDAATAQSAAEIESLLYEVERLKAENEKRFGRMRLRRETFNARRFSNCSK